MKILEKEILADVLGIKITRLELESNQIAKKARPGQFIVLMVTEAGERIPLTIVNTDKNKDTITLIFQEVGLTTKLLGKLDKGDSLYSLVGPLGHATEIIPPQRDPATGGKNYGKIILVGGGVGIAEIFPVAEALSARKYSEISPIAFAIGGKKEKNHLTTILGARTKELLILEKELEAISDEFYITTDDGSYGRKGFVTDILQEILNGPTGLVYAVGPIPMMKKVSSVTKKFDIKTIVSLNAIMVDATGMCGCCRVDVGGQTKFSCVDGPEFDAHLVDWDQLIKRNRIYEDKEKHICQLLIK